MGPVITSWLSCDRLHAAAHHRMRSNIDAHCTCIPALGSHQRAEDGGKANAFPGRTKWSQLPHTAEYVGAISKNLTASFFSQHPMASWLQSQSQYFPTAHNSCYLLRFTLLVRTRPQPQPTSLKSLHTKPADGFSATWLRWPAHLSIP